MDIVDCIIGIMYIVALGCVLYYINKFQMDKLKRDNKPINKVHFYVARDKDEKLWLYMGKPVRCDESFVSNTHGKVVIDSPRFIDFGLNESNYKDLKWEDEPIEVFLNLKD